MRRPKRWYDYLWIITVIYLLLGFVNILFAWLGIICFWVPVLLAVTGRKKSYCNNYCGRGQLLDLLGARLSLSRQRKLPLFVRTKWFRYSFLIFFLMMFGKMLFSTYLVGIGEQTIKTVVTLFWVVRWPWRMQHFDFMFPPWVVQFAFGFYSIMLTSTLLGIGTMLFYKPRGWCVYCPMGTMTQMICRQKLRRPKSLNKGLQGGAIKNGKTAAK